MKPINRRNFLGVLALTSTASTLSIPRLLAGSENRLVKDKNSEFKFLTEPYLQSLTPTNVSIMVITSKNASAWVKYGKESPTIIEQPESDGFKVANQTLFSIELEDLTPGKTYYYKVTAKEIVSFEPYELVYGKEINSSIFQFTTPLMDGDNVACLILNDIHDRPNSFGELISLNKQNPYDFVFLNGDMFNYQEDESQLINNLIAPCTDIFANEIPFILSRGNHETRGKFARNIKPYFTYPGDDYFFTFRQGPVFFIVLDTGEDKPDDTPVYADIVNFDRYREKQATWLSGVMDSDAYKEAPYRVVFMHIPPFHSDDWHGTLHCRKLFNPLFEAHKVDMVIAGHTHEYGVYSPQPDHSYPLIIGGGPEDGKRTLIRLDASLSRMKLVMIADNKQIVGEYTVNKKQA